MKIVWMALLLLALAALPINGSFPAHPLCLSRPSVEPSIPLTNILITNLWRTDFRYDALGRKGIRRDYNWVSNAWNRPNETRYIYDGFLLLQERNSNNVPQVTYTRGVDFSGSVDGAGGIGGLANCARPRTPQSHEPIHNDS